MSQWGNNQPRGQWNQPRSANQWPSAQPQWQQPYGRNQPTQQRYPSPQGQRYPAQAQPQRASRMKMILLLAIAVPIVLFASISLTDMVQGPGGGTGGGTGGGGSSTGYENEDYQVPTVDTNSPPIPQPETYGEAKTLMEDNALYSQQVAVPVRCEASAIDLMNSSNSALETHFNELTGCLMRVFGPSIEAAGYIPVRPSVTVYSSAIQTACGQMPSANASYCLADQQVYYASNLPTIIPPQLQGATFIVESVMAHEFGHAIQGRTGILYSELAWQQQAGKSDALELNRRTEVQADCFTGEFMQSVTESVGLTNSDLEQIGQLFYAIGDDQLTGNPNVEGNHGRGASRQAWYFAGLQSQSMGTCNSFTAPSSKVR